MVHTCMIQVYNKIFWSDCFRLFGLLQVHYFSHTTAKLFPCPFCARTYKTVRTLRTHIRHLCHKTKTSENKACHKCGKLVPLPTLSQHTRRCGSMAQKACPICNKNLAKTTDLRLHMLIHTDSFPFQCSTCGKCFSRRENLVNHLSIHTGEKPYVCTHCGKAFRMKCSLQGHEKSVHGIERKKPVQKHATKSTRRKNPTDKI